MKRYTFFATVLLTAACSESTPAAPAMASNSQCLAAIQNVCNVCASGLGTTVQACVDSAAPDCSARGLTAEQAACGTGLTDTARCGDPFTCQAASCSCTVTVNGERTELTSCGESRCIQGTTYTCGANGATAGSSCGGETDAGMVMTDSGTTSPRDSGVTPPRDSGVATDAGGSTERCGCQRDQSCTQYTGASCAAVAAAVGCAGGRIVNQCSTAAVATCELDGATTYHSVPVPSSSCSGRFTVTPPPAPTGSPCSCVRNANLCVGAWGAACGSLSCAAPSSSECATANATAGVCASADGQTRLRFYGVTVGQAEEQCLRQNGYRWLP